MTVADPHGAFVDTIRSCYVSWMNTPDAGRIRVRWYKVTVEPGVYVLGDYSSSDWDEDPKCYDPDLGEESTTRNPFVDWRDCSPPPWDAFLCENAATPTAEFYTCVLSGLVGDGYTTHLNGEFLLFNRLPCYWDGTNDAPIQTSTILFLVLEDGNVYCQCFEKLTPLSGTAVAAAEYQTLKPPAMDRAFTVPLLDVAVPGVSFPPFLTFVPTYIPPAGNLATENGRNLLTENEHPLHTESEELS